MTRIQLQLQPLYLIVIQVSLTLQPPVLLIECRNILLPLNDHLLHLPDSTLLLPRLLIQLLYLREVILVRLPLEEGLPSQDVELFLETVTLYAHFKDFRLEVLCGFGCFVHCTILFLEGQVLCLEVT